MMYSFELSYHIPVQAVSSDNPNLQPEGPFSLLYTIIHPEVFECYLKGIIPAFKWGFTLSYM